MRKKLISMKPLSKLPGRTMSAKRVSEESQ